MRYAQALQALVPLPAMVLKLKLASYFYFYGQGIKCYTVYLQGQFLNCKKLLNVLEMVPKLNSWVPNKYQIPIQVLNCPNVLDKSPNFVIVCDLMSKYGL